MRNPERISRIMGKMQRLWEKSPDLRFGQFFYNMEHKMFYSGLPVHIIQDGLCRTGFDPFHIEDDKFEEFLDTLLGN